MQVRQRPLDPLRSVLRNHERIHLRSQGDELWDDAARSLVLHQPHLRFAKNEVGVVHWVGGRAIAQRCPDSPRRGIRRAQGEESYAYQASH